MAGEGFFLIKVAVSLRRNTPQARVLGGQILCAKVVHIVSQTSGQLFCIQLFRQRFSHKCKSVRGNPDWHNGL